MRATILCAKLALTVLATLRGSICLYQGEELGLTEADLAFEDLRDPYGIRFWPAFKGRDGCRTPMVWEHGQPFAGFSTVKPWLPVPSDHAEIAVDRQNDQSGSVLSHYRQTLAFRKAHGALVEGDIAFLPTNQDLLAFTRTKGEDTFVFVFNLTREAVQFTMPADIKGAKPFGIPGFNPDFDGKVVSLGSMDAFCGKL